MSLATRQYIKGAVLAAIVLTISGYLLVWPSWQDIRSFERQIDEITSPAPAPPADSPEQRAAIPQVLGDDVALSAIRSAASGLDLQGIDIGPTRRLGSDGPVIHPYEVTMVAGPRQLATFARRLQAPIRLEGGRVVGKSGALLMTVASFAPTEDPADPASAMVVTVHGFSYR